MNTLWHFGDSWGTCDESETIYTKYIANRIGMNHQNDSYGGSSNRRIIKQILSRNQHFKPGDVILINWSFPPRFDYFFVDYVNDIKASFQPLIEFNTHLDEITPYHEWVIHGALNFHTQNRFLELDMIQPYFESLHHKGIVLYHTFQEQYSIHYPFIHSAYIELHKNYTWQNSMEKLGYAKEESVHYKWGIQEELANKVYDKMNLIQMKHNTTTDHSTQVDNPPT